MQYEIEDLGRYQMIHIIGNITPEVGTKVLEGAIAEHMSLGHHHFVFNLERTSYLDSAGIGIFINCLCDVQQNKGSIFIIAEDNQVYEVLVMVGIDRLIRIFGSVAEFKTEHMNDK